MLAALYRTPTVLMTLTAAMWAMNAIFGQLVVGEITPFAVVFLRWVMVASIMWTLYGREARACWPALRGRLGFLALASIAGFTGFNTLFYIASAHTTGINIGILQGAMPVAVLIGAFLAYGDRVGPMQMLGVVLTLVGVVLVASGGDIQRLTALSFNEGDLIMLAATVLYSGYAVALRKRPDMPGTALFTLLALVAAISALPLAAWEAIQPGYPWPTAKGIGLTLMIAIFPSCIAQLFFLRGVDLIGPGRAGVYINLVPIFASILAILILGEVFAPYHGAALALVIGGIWLAQRQRA
ncbi:DMT family transporter [Pikeienuella piscinae]|uniref:DMT family transporter n=1 Tax=Pikeienuella piscinae TaxID=2748098 RepID=A0A7L5C0Q3_9RHOB|nr:DMT family transporter [Pikeienuella piscinae]QIE55724.1 DMT family transporter [Pikeienuella piscinae]